MHQQEEIQTRNKEIDEISCVRPDKIIDSLCKSTLSQNLYHPWQFVTIQLYSPITHFFFFFWFFIAREALSSNFNPKNNKKATKEKPIQRRRQCAFALILSTSLCTYFSFLIGASLSNDLKNQLLCVTIDHFVSRFIRACASRVYMAMTPSWAFAFSFRYCCCCRRISDVSSGITSVSFVVRPKKFFSNETSFRRYECWRGCLYRWL